MKFCFVALCFLSSTFAQQIPHFLYITTPILELDASLSSTLNLSDGQNFKDGSRTEVFLANFKQGDIVELRVVSEFDAYLSLYGPQKTLLASNDDGVDTLESLLITEIPETGRYTIVVSGYSELDMGSYKISAKKFDISDATELSLDSSINGFLSQTRDQVDEEGRFIDTFTLEISQAIDVIIQMNSTPVDSYLKLVDENGQIVAENDDRHFEDDLNTVDIDEGQAASLNAEIVVSLEPGSYRIIAASFSNGFYQLFVSSK
jgi:hypothetical protein